MTIDDSVKNVNSGDSNNTAPHQSLREFLETRDYSRLRKLLAPYVGELQAMAERARALANADYSQYPEGC